MDASRESRLASQHDYRNEARKRHLLVDPKLLAVYLPSSFKRTLTQLFITCLMHELRGSREISFHCDFSPKLRDMTVQLNPLVITI